MWRPPYTQSRSVDIEMTAYALLVYSHNKDVSNAVPIAKWIVAQRNPNGGFSSTQVVVCHNNTLSCRFTFMKFLEICLLSY